MAWTSPMTAVANAAFTAAQFNTHVRDNLNETAPAKATTAGRHFIATGANSIVERGTGNDVITTSETIAGSGSYGDLTTIGPTTDVTLTSYALGFWTAEMSNSGAGNTSYMGMEVSGASSLAASDPRAAYYESGNANDQIRMGMVDVFTGLTAGSNTFTAKYRATAGTSTFQRRKIIIMAF